MFTQHRNFLETFWKCFMLGIETLQNVSATSLRQLCNSKMIIIFHLKPFRQLAEGLTKYVSNFPYEKVLLPKKLHTESAIFCDFFRLPVIRQ
jgi:hypothetical protein